MLVQDTSTLFFAAGGVLTVYAFVSLVVYSLFSTQEKYLRTQSWVGVKKQWLAKFRAGFDSIMHIDAMVAEGYEKYSKYGKTFILPQFSRPPFVVLPADKVHEFLTKGDDRVDHQTVGRESIAMKYAIGSDFEDDSHFEVVRRQLTRKLPQLTNDVFNELVLAMQRNWPLKENGEWTTVKAYPTCMRIVSQAANRVFSGKELCRNQEFLDNCRMYAQEVFKSGAILKLIPHFLHPIFAPIVVRGVRRHFAVCKKHAVPVIKERLHRMRTQGKAYVPSTDVLQWILDEVEEADAANQYRRDPEWITRCLLLLNMVAIHTTSMVTTNTMLDLFSSPDVADYVAGLREETQRVLAASNGEWTKDAVNSLLRVDSTLRETMRISALGTVGLPRIVNDPNGIDLSGGIHIPYGVRVVVPSRSIHMDSQFYPDPTTWDGFRFSRPREEFEASLRAKQAAEKVANGSIAERSAEDKARLEKVLEHKNRGLIVTTDDFFSFGFGKHACPGRFFASQEMKLMMAYVVNTYDVKIEGGRPENISINGASLPSDNAEMQIRFRQT